MTDSSQPCQVLLVGPLPSPPLLGGVEVGVDMLLKTDLAKRSGMRLFNNWRVESATRSMWQRLAYQLTACVRFAVAVLRSRCPVVHVKTSSGINFYQNGLYALIARLLGRRVLLQIHSGGFPDFYQSASKLQRAVIRGILKLPQRLLALSPWWADHFAAFVSRETIGIVPNVTHTALYRSAQPNRERFGIPPDRLVVFFMGTRDRRSEAAKGLFELLEAMKELRQRYPQLLLVVAGSGSHRAEIEQALGPEGEHWLGVGVVTAEVKPVLYRSVDLFVLPSYYENMPNTLIEAMAAGVPSVATAVGAIPDMIRDGETGFIVPPHDAKALAARLAALISDPELRLAVAAAAAEAAAATYDLPVLEDALAEEYRSLHGQFLHELP